MANDGPHSSVEADSAALASKGGTSGLVHPARQRTADLLWLVLLGLIWGASYLFIKVAVAEMPPFTLVAGRLALGAVLLWILIAATRTRIPSERTVWITYAALGVINGAIPYSLIFWAEQHIASGLAALLQATMPIFAAILAYFFAHERMTPTQLFGVLIGFIGVGILMIPELRQGFGYSLLAQLAVVGSSLSYAGAASLARRQLRSQPPLVSTAGQLTSGAALMVPLALAVDRPFHLSPSLPAVASWLALTLAGTVLAYIIYFSLLERTSATFVSTVTYISPVSGVLLGVVVLAEPFTASLAAGLALILLGVVLVRH